MRTLPLLIVIMALALLIAPALADQTIAVNQDYTDSSGMVVHLQKVSITDRNIGTGFSSDPANTVWPKLYFTYENKGTTATIGYLDFTFFDDKGNQYPSDKHLMDGTMNQINPGDTSDQRFVEGAVPKGTTIAGFTIYDGKNEKKFLITNGQVTASTSAPTSGAATGTAASTPGICGLTAVLPLVIVGTVIIARKKR